MNLFIRTKKRLSRFLSAFMKKRQSRIGIYGPPNAGKSALANALHAAVQAAQTRLMTDSGVFSKKATAMRESAHKKSSGSVANIPIWVWVGVGVLLAVVASVVILLATS